VSDTTWVERLVGCPHRKHSSSPLQRTNRLCCWRETRCIVGFVRNMQPQYTAGESTDSL